MRISRAEELRIRADSVIHSTVRLVDSLPDKPSAAELGRQLLLAVAELAKTYREAASMLSAQEVVPAMDRVVQDADSALHWLDFMAKAELGGRAIRKSVQSIQEDVKIMLALAIAAADHAKAEAG